MRPSNILTVLFAVTAGAESSMKALVYRGPAACEGCPEAVAKLLESSPSNFSVNYAGPKEDIDITPEALSKVEVYVQPGGGGLDKTWPEMKPYSKHIRDFVNGGGRYMGFCLGAYLAGRPGFDLLPSPDNTDEEIIQPEAEVKDERNTIIKVNWHFQTGELAGKTQKRWVFFQDGAVMKMPNMKNVKVLGRYASNDDIAATISPFGKGWVGNTGPHPEADRSWCECVQIVSSQRNTDFLRDTPYKLENPDGINFDIGFDFVETVAHWK